MGQYFDNATTGETLWNPATRVAQLFYGMTEVLVPVAGRPCGVVDLRTDEYAVDPEPFTAFVDALVTEYLASNHAVLKAMLAGYLPAALVMVKRSGNTVAALTKQIERSAQAISLNTDAFDPDADRHDLTHRAAAVADSMPTG
ncbi:DUF6086 family protein [Actinoplanes sp. TRM 88003]|uniref:DUF6086 family protein n=1 Tax=Paractinoplanes aksuensis TaxID=2939490 RepID=A0ABT1E187_9ACTN|nr:DUF6086 family protein [Actinoplanes aksuensis]MCO8276889.1 DUF6086 family protein [Actinoplanes aksuensis]